MLKLLNWTSLTFVVTLVGVAFPIWYWRADPDAKSLSLHVASQTPLTSASAGTIQGLEVLMDGVKVESPTLSVVILINDGKKPLPKSDFEAPVEVRVDGGSRIIRADVTSTQPKDIEAKIETDKGAVRFSPVLMNPEESITVSILTEGGRPSFSSRARVVGVTKVDFVDATKKTSTFQRSMALIVATLLLFTIAESVNVNFLGGPKVIFVRKRAAVLIKILGNVGGLLVFAGFALTAELKTSWWIVGLIPIMLLATVIGAVLNIGAKSIVESGK